VAHVVVATGEDIVAQRAAAPLQPRTHRLPGRVHQLELDWPIGLLLHDNGAIPDASARDYIADPDFDDVAAAQFAVDREIEQRSVA
jgi:hypothetical protein